MAVHLTPIGVLHTCFKEKFGIPRQPNLVGAARATLTFYPEFARPEAVRELEQFSHLWLIFVFHTNMAADKADSISDKDTICNKGAPCKGSGPGLSPKTWSPMVRPPRLGGNQKVGVFASRSPFRPNPIGLSCVALDRIDNSDKGPVLHLSGVDILDQTPVLDIKPYLPYADIIEGARDGFAKGPPKACLSVEFSPAAESHVRQKETRFPGLRDLITGMLENDPRPAYANKTDSDRIYGFTVFDVDVKWQVKKDRAIVISLERKED